MNHKEALTARKAEAKSKYKAPTDIIDVVRAITGAGRGEASKIAKSVDAKAVVDLYGRTMVSVGKVREKLRAELMEKLNVRTVQVQDNPKHSSGPGVEKTV